MEILDAEEVEEEVGEEEDDGEDSD